MSTFSVASEVNASPAIVWSVLSDYPGMRRWAGARRVEVERQGSVVPNGVGTIRALKSWHGTVREEITSFEPERSMTYKGLSGVPARDYHGAIELERHGAATAFTWTVHFEPRRLTGAIFPFVIKRTVQTGVDRLVEIVEAEANQSQL